MKFIYIILLIICIFQIIHNYVYRSHLKYNLFQTHLKSNVVFRSLNSNIPKLIHQTYSRKDKVPEKVFINIKQYAPKYVHKVYDDQQAIEFLQSFFSESVSKCFKNLVTGAHKADLFRYAILYIYGGIYLDIKTELVEDIEVNNTFPDNCITTVLSSKKNEIYQGVISAPPGQQIFLNLIHSILKSGSYPLYNRFCLDFYMFINIDLNGKKIKQGYSYGTKHSYLLYQEKCSTKLTSKLNTLYPKCSDGFDRYGFCCNIVDTKIRIKTRYADYPWL